MSNQEVISLVFGLGAFLIVLFLLLYGLTALSYKKIFNVVPVPFLLFTSISPLR